VLKLLFGEALLSLENRTTSLLFSRAESQELYG